VLAFLASDDAWLPNRLSSQRHDVEVAGAGYAKVAIVLDDETHLVDTPRYGVDGRRVFHQLLWKNVIPASTIMVRREVFDRAGGFYGNPRFEDLDLMLRVSAITPVSYHPAVVGRHRMLGTGIEETTRSEGRVVAASLEAIDRLVAWPGLPASLRPEATRWQSAWRVLHDIAGGADVGELDVGVAARLGRLVVIHELYLSPAQLERVKAFQRRASLRSQGVLRAAGVATMISEQVRQEGAFGAATSWSRRVARPVRQRLRRLLIRAELD
jgi:hypothetical protein